MTGMTIDRCYDRYLITFRPPEEDEADTEAAQGVQLLRDTLCAALEQYSQQGRLRALRMDEAEGELCLDVEAALGHEDYLAAAIDAIAGGICLLAERWADSVDIEM